MLSRGIKVRGCNIIFFAVKLSLTMQTIYIYITAASELSYLRRYLQLCRESNNSNITCVSADSNAIKPQAQKLIQKLKRNYGGTGEGISVKYRSGEGRS
jgi:hypothetical protein